MSGYELFKTLHILAAIIWIGAGVTYLVVHHYLHAKTPRTEMFAVLAHTDRLAPAIFVPAVLATLVFGIVMVIIEDSLSFADLWITLGFAGLGVSFVLGTISGVPMAARLTRLSEELGPDAPAVTSLSSRILQIAYVEIVILVAVVTIMVVKPGA